MLYIINNKYLLFYHLKTIYRTQRITLKNKISHIDINITYLVLKYIKFFTKYLNK